MEIGLPGDDDPRRAEVRAWLADHPAPTGRDLAEAGYVAPHWPVPYGLGADPVTQLVIDDEMRRAGVHRPANPIGIGWAGPTIMHAGTDAQKARWLLPMLSGEEMWCQLFSEPDAGSDLASLRTRAVLDGDEWVVEGHKVWTTFAHSARWGILLARTAKGPDPHRTISYFVCPMDLPGLTVRPLVDMTGLHAFNEVVFDQVRIPADHLVGRPGDGWGLARVTLGNERVSLSGEGALWGRGPTAQDLVDIVRTDGAMADRGADPVLRQRLAAAWIEGKILSVLRLRTVSALLAGHEPGPEASVRKALADDHGKELMNLARDLLGSAGMLDGTGPGDDPGVWSYGFLFSPALTVGGGTAQIQRNIVAERILGLPRDLPRPIPGTSPPG